MDTALVIQAQSGDRGAFARLVDTEWERLRRVAYGILRDTALADDATQQALLSVWRDLPRLRDPVRYEAWVHRLLVRRCYAEAKRQRRSPTSGPPLVESDAAPGDDYRAVEERDELERAFRRLTVEQRTLIALHYYAGLPLNHISEAMGVPAGTVYSRLHRSLKELRALLEADSRAGEAGIPERRSTR